MQFLDYHKFMLLLYTTQTSMCFSVPDGISDTSQFPNLVAEMLARGWTEDNIKKAVGLNIIRVLRDVEQVKTRQGYIAIPFYNIIYQVTQIEKYIISKKYYVLTSKTCTLQVRDDLELLTMEADETLIDYNQIPDLSCKNLPDWTTSL